MQSWKTAQCDAQKIWVGFDLLSICVDVVHSFHIKDSPGCDFIQLSLLLQKGHVSEDGLSFIKNSSDNNKKLAG